MTRLVRLGKAALALVLLGVLIVAAPVVLASFGNPIGDAVDTFADPLASDATRTEAVLVAVLATVGWVCWAMVLTALLTETVAAVRGTVARPLPLLLPGIQPTVRALLSAVTVASTALPAGASPPLPPPPVLAVADGHDLASQPADPEPAAAPAEAGAPVGPVYVVERGDTWWSIAETVLGSGTRWAEVVAANDGHTMPDGTTLTADTARPRPGWTLALPPAAVLALQTPPEPDPPAGQVHVVEAGDSLWDIAQSYVTDDSNQAIVDTVDVIAQANDLADPNVISVGQPLVIPNTITDRPDGPAGGPAGAVVVEPGDTLWGLAAEHLGDGHRYHDIVDLNAGRPQPDGQALTDPSFIEAGWVLNLPDTATPQPTAPQPVPAPAEPAPAPPHADPSPDAAESAAPAPEPEPARNPTPTPAAPRPTVQPGPSPASEAPPTSPADAAVDAVDEEQEEAAVSVPVGLLGAGLTAAAAVVVLERRRRLQRQRRPRGHLLPDPPPKLSSAETELRAAAPPAALQRVMAALQAAAAGSGIEGLPPVRYVTVDASEVSVALDLDCPAPPGFTNATPDRWVTTESFGTLADRAGGTVDPLPLLCPIGTTTTGHQVLVDLERHGAITVAGDPEAMIGLLRSVALAMATVPWAAAPQLTTVGLTGEIGALPWVTTADTLTDALARLDAHAAEVLAALPHAGATLAQARASGATPDAWNPAVVVSAEPPWETHQTALAARAANAPDATAVVVPAPSHDTGTVILRVDGERRVTFDGLDLDDVVASCLSSDDVRVVGDLLAGAARADTAPAPDQYRPGGVRASEATSGEPFGDVDVLVRVMGTVTVERVDGDQPAEIDFGRGKSREAVVFMACRDDGTGVTTEAVEAALWPAGANSRRTFNNTITDARRSLGHTPDGGRYLPAASDGRYRISERVKTDFELFWATVEQAENTDDATTAAGLLAQALSLVRGEPFTGAGLDYAWTAPTRTAVQTAVIDVADELGEILLAAGDLRGAERAARAGLTAAPGEERLYRFLMRAAAASGSRPMIDRIWRELRDVLADPDHGIEPEGTMSEETIQLFNELTSEPSRRRTA